MLTQNNSALNLGIVAILLANTKKSLKFYRFELAQTLVAFIDLIFCFACFWFILLPRLALFLVCSLILNKNRLMFLENSSYKKSVLQFL